MEQNKMEVLKMLYKAQVEIANAYETCTDESLKKVIMQDYENFELLVSGLEKDLSLFEEEN